MDKQFRAGIIGAAGYTGGEMIRLLIHHPSVALALAHSKSSAGKAVYEVHEDLLGQTALLFCGDEALENPDIDVLFCCTGHGETRRLLPGLSLRADTVVIDLSQDFRLSGSNHLGDRSFIYGLPEAFREQIRTAKNIANPGCFATALQLALLPLANARLLPEDVFVTGITGSTGAGQSLSSTGHFSWRANNIQAYKTLSHQHLGEIGETLRSLSGDSQTDIHFVPWRGDFTRGIFASATTRFDGNLEEANRLYEDFYRDHPFTHVSRKSIHLKQVVNTNNAVLQLEKQGRHLVVHSIIDNLLKGASGQAVQNMNLVLGLPETTGLQLKSIGF